MCGRGRYEGIGISDLEEFQEDGKCLYPFFDLYDEGLDKLGAYEIGGGHDTCKFNTRRKSK
jgi:hypothetical protein